jgi:copper chaperone NosL
MARQIVSVLAAVFLITACSEMDTGPVEVKWDRDVCERCRMMLSDRQHAAQVRGGEKNRAYKFDDIGGAILWLEDKDWKLDPSTEVWVTDHRDERWIDAKKAWFVTGHNTPMEFGLGAQSTPIEGAMSFQQAVEYIIQRENKYNQSGADLKEQADEHKHHDH